MIKLSILWHMHQPYYADPYSGNFLLPWVRLHSIKDYLQMGLLLLEHPNIKVCFNFTPSLLLQIQEYIEGKRDMLQIFAFLEPEKIKKDITFLEKNFFCCYHPTLLEPFPHYKRLYEKRKNLSPQNINDLQVWSNLCWFSPMLRNNVKELFRKGRNFSEKEKNALFTEEKNIMQKIIPLYKRLLKKGQIEITTSAFYHPIIPLLCKTDIAKLSNPAILLPPTFSYPEDARAQIRKARIFFKKIFGQSPNGFWPPEGGVSYEAVELVKKEGFLWIATDEGILKNTLEGASCYLPYKMEMEDGAIFLLFRERTLSDKISFVYWSWDEETAVEDFINRLKEIEKMEKDAFVLLALDGENAWERYKENGLPFLNLLYKRLAQEKIQTITPTDYLKEYEKKSLKLSSIFPGSWIDAKFDTWIGKEEKNLAWRLLHVVRKSVGKNKEALSYIYIAEGSDWFWWYGDEFATLHAEEFDYLFKANLKKAAEVVGVKVPEELR